MAKVYLVFEQESYCEYGVVYVSLDKNKAEEVVEQKNKECGYVRFRIEEKELDKYQEIKF
jgi:hypothetical protein